MGSPVGAGSVATPGTAGTDGRSSLRGLRHGELAGRRWAHDCAWGEAIREPRNGELPRNPHGTV